ncbi:LCP family protein [Nonomuraea sp. NPDC050556]|uniref:LCP family protein n=1 Tax=Nonomuraea sp. NPDC050556 TaxID=3364369 RepID=UPI0037993BE2
MRKRPGGEPAAGGRKRRSTTQGPRFAKPLNLGSVLGWTALSILVPGMAHLRAGHRRTGFALLGSFGVVLLGALVYGLTRGSAGAFARQDTLLTLIIAAWIGAVCWSVLVIVSYVALGPNRLDQTQQIISGILVGVLCVGVMAPFAVGATTLTAARGAIHDIFRPGGDTTDGGEPVKEIKQEDPWDGKPRVNFLLIGGDAAGNRTGVRTDSMTVASVDTKTGNTVMFSLPRNLQHVRFPPTSPLSKHFPNGYMAELPNGGLLNEIWQFGNDHPEIMGGKNRGPRALMDAISQTLGLKIDYYALINMYGFVDLVDAIGGIKIKVEKDIPWGGHYGTAGTIKAGYQKLTGEEALWYGRSRVVDDDFHRMARQRCVIAAFAKQATPEKILANFTHIASAAKKMAQTNIPADLVEHIANLALKVKGAKITSLQFVPPEFYTGSPDWVKIRRAAAKALADSAKPSRQALAANVTASPGSPSATPSRTHEATPTQTPTQNTNKNAKSLNEICGI